MKSGVVLLFITIGTLISATSCNANPSSLDVDDSSETNELLKLIDRDASSQQDNDDDSGDYGNALALLQGMNDVIEQADEDRDLTTTKELLDMINRVANLQEDGDDEDDRQAKAQLFGSIFRIAKNILGNHGGSIIKGIGRVLGGLFNGGGGGGGRRRPSPPRRRYRPRRPRPMRRRYPRRRVNRRMRMRRPRKYSQI